MNINGSKLKYFFPLEIALIISYRLASHYQEIVGLFWANRLYEMALAFGVYVVIYAFLIRCPACSARQVFRGWSFFDIRWPSGSCHRCGRDLMKQCRGHPLPKNTTD